jgi:oligogalacturonide lyase
MQRPKSAAGVLLLFAILLANTAHFARAAEIPDEFTDPETGLRIVHVSRVPNDRSGVIYFTQDCITADSQRVIFHVQFQEKWRHLYTFDLATQKVVPLVTDRLIYGAEFSSKNNNVYYQADGGIWSTNIDSLQSHKLADLPAEWGIGTDLTLNADQTLLAAATDEGSKQWPATTQSSADSATAPNVPPETQRLKSMGSTFAAHRPNLIYTINLKTGELKVIYRINTWLGHVQFSPTEPAVLMFCHEGPWEKVDRIWTIHPDGSDPQCFFNRTEPHEIAGHEFWSTDGKTIWFQHTFRDSKKSFLTGKNVLGGSMTNYSIPPAASAIHQLISPDEHFFIGDGTGKTATGPNKYLTMQVPDGDTLRVTKLCSLQKNDYAQCEPNPHITPDQHWVIFTATFFGTPQAYALQLPQSLWRTR